MEMVRKDCGNIADTMRKMGGPAADATSECTPGPPYSSVVPQGPSLFSGTERSGTDQNATLKHGTDQEIRRMRKTYFNVSLVI